MAFRVPGFKPFHIHQTTFDELFWNMLVQAKGADNSQDAFGSHTH